jgi:hypothetical protein
MNFILGLIITTIGVLMIIKTEWLVQNFGRIAWFDKHLGTEGGTRLGYKLIAIILLFFGILSITGLHIPFFNWLLSPLMRASI